MHRIYIHTLARYTILVYARNRRRQSKVLSEACMDLFFVLFSFLGQIFIIIIDISRTLKSSPSSKYIVIITLLLIMYWQYNNEG